MRVVVRIRIRVEIAFHQLVLRVFLDRLTEKVKCQVVRKTGKGKLRLEKTYSSISTVPHT